MRLFISVILSTVIAGTVLLILEYQFFKTPEHTIPTPVIAVYLSEMGYFQGNINTVTKSDIERSLLLFQRDAKIQQTGQLDDKTWELLRNVNLSSYSKKILKDMQLDEYTTKQ